MTEQIKDAAVCIIENVHGQILILQRSKIPHGFGLPGGKVDPGEEIIDACIREVVEETGMEIVLHEGNKLGVVRSAIREYNVHVYYLKLDNVFQENVNISDEHVGYIWTSKPKYGLDLAGKTNKMIKLWKYKQKFDYYIEVACANEEHSPEVNSIYLEAQKDFVRMYTWDEFVDTLRYTKKDKLPKFRDYRLGDGRHKNHRFTEAAPYEYE